MRNKIFIAVLFILFGFSTPAAALDSDEPAEPESTLEEIVVTAGRLEEKNKEVASSASLIHEEEIRQSSADNLGDLLAEKGIGHIHKYPGALSAVGLRGFRTETHGNDLLGHVLVLINGRRAGTGNATKILTHNIERVEIVRGPASVQYGSAAMGGVINVITKKGKGEPKWFIEGKYGSFGAGQGNVGFSGERQGFDFFGSVSVEHGDDYKTGSDKTYKNTDYRQHNFNLNIGSRIRTGHRWSLILNHFNADNIGNPDYLSRNDLDDYTQRSNDSLDFVYDGKTENGRLSWKARMFMGEDKDIWVYPVASNTDGWDDGRPVRTKSLQKGLQGQVSLKQEALSLTLGMDWVDYNVTTTWQPQKTSYNNPAAFFLAKTKFFDQRLILTGGIRYDAYELEVIAPPGNKERDSNLSPRVGAAFLLNDYIKLRANYGEAFIMPGAEQLAADYVNWGRRTLGNPELNPEKSRTWEGGIDFSYNSLNASFTYFDTRYRDKIESTTLQDGTSTWENRGKASIKGFEGELAYDLGELFAWSFQLRPYINAVYLTEYKDKEAGTDLKYFSDLTLSYGILLTDLYGFSANLNIAYRGEQFIEDWETGLIPAPVIRKGGFTVANLCVSRSFTLHAEKDRRLTLRGEIQNLFDADYEYVKGFPMPGIGFFFGLRYDY